LIALHIGRCGGGFLIIGATIEHYEITSQLGKGGMEMYSVRRPSRLKESARTDECKDIKQPMKFFKT